MSSRSLACFNGSLGSDVCVKSISYVFSKFLSYILSPRERDVGVPHYGNMAFEGMELRDRPTPWKGVSELVRDKRYGLGFVFWYPSPPTKHPTLVFKNLDLPW